MSCTPNEESFCQEFMLDRNVTRAAERAGLAVHTGFQMLQRPHVQERLEALGAQQAQRVAVDSDRILQELLRVAYVDPIDLFDERGHLLPLSAMPEAARRAVGSIDVHVAADGSVTHKVRLHGKLDALKMLGQYKQLFSDISVKVQDSNVLVLIDGVDGAKALGPSAARGGMGPIGEEVARDPNLLPPVPEQNKISPPAIDAQFTLTEKIPSPANDTDLQLAELMGPDPEVDPLS